MTRGPGAIVVLLVCCAGIVPAAADEAERVAKRDLRTLEKAVERVDALVGRLEEGKRDARLREAWEAARERARTWILDEVSFPVPAETVITGPKQGYREAKERGDEALEAYKALSRRLDRALRPALALSPEKARRLALAYEDARAAYAESASALPDAAPAPQPDPFALLLLDTRLGRLREGIAAYGTTPPGWARLCLYHALCRAVLEHNERNAYDMEPGAVEGLRAMNRLRIALGISPLVHREELVRMAYGHSHEMTTQGFFSHRSPTPGRETKEDRAKLAGYDGRVVECITGAGGGATAVEFWRYDGGHHRDMCNPKVVEGGFSTRGPAVYVGGKGGDDHLPGFLY